MEELHPLVTVITVVRNAVATIEATLQSVVALKDKRLHYVVLDGGSNDGTLEILQHYAGAIDYWHTRPDGGIYEAMNEALTYATGDYVININAGDRLLHIPYACLEHYRSDVACAAVCGAIVTEQGSIIAPHASKNYLRCYNTLPHQGLFYKRSLLVDHPYDTRYRVFADFDLNQRLFLLAGKRWHLDECVVAEHAMDGVSNQSQQACELFAIIRQNCGYMAVVLAWCRFKYLGLISRIQQWNASLSS